MFSPKASADDSCSWNRYTATTAHRANDTKPLRTTGRR
jgi:hypothetical protein